MEPIEAQRGRDPLLVGLVVAIVVLALAVGIVFIIRDGSGDGGGGGGGTVAAGNTTTTGAPTSSSTTSSSSSTSTSTSSTTSSTSTTTSSTSTTIVDGPVSENIEDGDHYGFFTEIVIGDVSGFGQFDLVEFLTGAAAQQAAEEDGVVLDTEYYVRNRNPMLRNLVFDPQANIQILVSPGNPQLITSNVADFQLVVQQRPESLWFLTIEQGLVTFVEEQFLA